MIHHIIKPSLLFSIILLSCSNPLYDASEYIVPEKSKQELKDYLIKNRFNLNPIEGIWTLGVIRTLYENGKMIAFEEEDHRMSLAVVKEGDLFRVYDINGEPTNFIATFKETDELGGYDPYSASKGCAEFIIQSYIKSFFIKKRNIRVGVTRAGNVIGGGDWSKNRLIPDIVYCSSAIRAKQTWELINRIVEKKENVLYEDSLYMSDFSNFISI